MAAPSITGLLGGKKALGRSIRAPMDFIEMGRKGVPMASLLRLMEYTGLSTNHMAKLLHLSVRTIQRYPAKHVFVREVSETILQLASVVARGVEAFEDREAFLAWLKQPCISLGRQTPMSLLSSRFGMDMILDELTRIEHGVVS